MAVSLLLTASGVKILRFRMNSVQMPQNFVAFGKLSGFPYTDLCRFAVKQPGNCLYFRILAGNFVNFSYCFFSANRV